MSRTMNEDKLKAFAQELAKDMKTMGKQWDSRNLTNKNEIGHPSVNPCS